MDVPSRPVAASFVFLLALARPACADARPPRNPWQDWTTLQLKVRSAPLLRGTVELRLSDVAGGRRLETSTSVRFLGATIARSETATVLDATTGRTKEYYSYSRKKGRRYRFGASGYTVEKLRPAGAEGDAWEVSSSREYPYPVVETGGVERLFDYYGMLVSLHDLGLDAPGDEITLFVATSSGPESYRIRVSESRTSERSFVNLDTGETTTLPSVEFRLSVAPTDPESEEGFLSMEGETEIWVEAETKTLLEIVGKVPKVPGKVKLVLSALARRPFE